MASISSLSILSFSVNADNSVTFKFKNAFMVEQTAMNTSSAQQLKVKTRGIILKKSQPLSANNVNDQKNIFKNGCMARSKSVALDINFRTNSKNIQKPAEITGIASAMNSNQLADCYFIVEGYTDATGNNYYNLWLSQKRAEQVKQYLHQHNVDENRLIVVGKGEGELINHTVPNAPENRRVVFKVVNYLK